MVFCDMNNIEYKKPIVSEEIAVRDMLFFYIKKNYDYEADRESIRFRGGVIHLLLPPLIKKRLIRDFDFIARILKGEEIFVSKIC